MVVVTIKSALIVMKSVESLQKTATNLQRKKRTGEVMVTEKKI